MSVAEMFSEFVGNLKVCNAETISLRYGELTSALNKQFRDTDSKVANSLQVGSFGRRTGINGISDLDMLYIMPKSKWADYNIPGGQLKLLQATRDAICKRYPLTKIRVDRLVVTVTYSNFHIEVQPVFELADESYRYPDTKNGGSWKTTNPRPEMDAVAQMDAEKSWNLRRLCKMTRAWKNKHGVAMGGLLIDTLAYNFLDSTQSYDNKSYLYYDEMSRDFFKFLSEEPNQDRYLAPGSRQHVKVKKRFQRKAKRAHELCLKAIEAEASVNANDKWKKIYGRPFPAGLKVAAEARGQDWDDTEEFIEDRFTVDIRTAMTLDCDIKQNGFRKYLLSEILLRRPPLKSNKKLRFWVKELEASKPYDIYWKVLNRGEEAEKRNLIRGQIVCDGGHGERQETSDFRGDHVVECYCVKDGVVVAKDRVHVPIESDGSDYE